MFITVEGGKGLVKKPDCLTEVSSCSEIPGELSNSFATMRLVSQVMGAWSSNLVSPSAE